MYDTWSLTPCACGRFSAQTPRSFRRLAAPILPHQVLHYDQRLDQLRAITVCTTPCSMTSHGVEMSNPISRGSTSGSPSMFARQWQVAGYPRLKGAVKLPQTAGFKNLDTLVTHAR
jgi:hypothetical protein